MHDEGAVDLLGLLGVDRGEEKAELCFLVVLHSLENFLIVLASRLVYLQESYSLGIVVFDCVLVLLNILAVLVSVLYVKKIELYAGLPKDVPSALPSFGPEVSMRNEDALYLSKYLTFFPVSTLKLHYQDLSNGSENFNLKGGETNHNRNNVRNALEILY